MVYSVQVNFNCPEYFMAISIAMNIIFYLSTPYRCCGPIILFLNKGWCQTSKCGNDDHCSYVVMSTMVSQITSVSIVCSFVCSVADHRKHQSSAPLAFVRGIHRWPVNSPHNWPVTRKMFPFDDAIMTSESNAGKELYTLVSCLWRQYFVQQQQHQHQCNLCII